MDAVAFLNNSTASWEDVAQSGPACAPLKFDPPIIGRAERVDAPVYNPSNHDIMEVSNIIYERHPDGRPPARAYWVGRKLKKCIFGVVKSCTILKLRNDADVPWEVTGHMAAVKILSWQKIRDIQHIENPQQEVSAMQLLARNGAHKNVMPLLDALQDEDYLLMFMPFCDSGDLFGFVVSAGLQTGGGFPEPMARYWFQQILDGIEHMQKMGVCHRDMSLENLMVDKVKNSIIIDMGMCLRVPYITEDGTGVTDVSSETMRLMILPDIPCGKYNYISPEILGSQQPFDGFAIDLWAVGVILHIMLAGVPPWEIAREDDARFRQISRGGLESVVRGYGWPISPAAVDLMQRMLLADPRQRLSLSEIKDHPWYMEEVPEVDMADPIQNEGWRY